MADKQDERDATNGAADRSCNNGFELHDVAEMTLGKNYVLSPYVTETADGSDSRVELTVKDVPETSDILEYFPSSQGGAGHYQVVNQITDVRELLSRSVAESPGIVTSSTNYATVSGEFLSAVSPGTTTIIYVQPDGTFVEGGGLTVEEQQQLVEQLDKQQLGETADSESRLVSEQTAPPRYGHCAALSPTELQQVIQQVARSQSISHRSQQNVASVAQGKKSTPPVSEKAATGFALGSGSGTPGGNRVNTMVAQPLTIMHNASQQLQNVAKQVALQQSQSQNGSRLKKLEPIQFQVQVSPAQEVKERPVPPSSSSAVFQQVHVPSGQLDSKESVPTSISVGCPQIIHIAPVAGEQHYILHNAGDPPIQLLVQRPEAVTGRLVPLLQKMPVHAPARAVAAGDRETNPAPVTQKKERQRDTSLKRPQKIKTRSGRVSRPPKYKVKDYKFIKRTDLADGHQSDSDDYSELSIEEEEGEEGKVNVDVNFNLNNKAFKCKTCEKAYIGNGGLSRHYKLNPTHKPTVSSQEGSPPIAGQQDTAAVTSPSSTPSEGLLLESAQGESSAVPDTAVQGGHSGLTSAVQGSNCSEGVQPNLSAFPAGSEAQSNQESVLVGHETPLCTLQKHGPGRPKGPGRPGRPKIAARRARRGRPGRPPKHFGGTSVEQQLRRNKAWLKEVLQQCSNEELMEMVLPRLAKVMTVWEFLLLKVEKGCPSRPHFSDVYREFQQLQQQVKKMAQDHASSSRAQESHADTDLSESQEFKTLPPAKRFKLEKAIVEVSGVCVDQDMTQKGAEKEQTLSKKDSCFAVKEVHSSNGTAVETSPVRSVVMAANCTDVQTNQESKSPLAVMDQQGARVLHTQAVALAPQIVFTTLETDATPEVTVEEELADSTGTSSPPRTAGNSKADADPDQALSELCENRCQVMETSEVLNGSGITDQVTQHEEVLNADVAPLDHSYRIVEVSEQPGESVNGLEQQCSEGNGVTLASAVELQMQEPGQKSYQDKIVIHTECGLIMHHAEDCLASESIVIVTDVDGASEEVPLETVQALLGFEPSQNEGIMVSETHH